ncbi:glycosyltransferase family 39 protein [Patescibacteria group bacterium]|nr:glycosyltransferase family 39 protein [Patescibacteria group bacterium]MBU0777355.1 glycosyltransferase family 39 protein [Patescibacteria group bacterium]MBU0845983.1 glycosyltransferase family 39 protein [Patescibacteria group bacterium]MBU0922531.1 glycosyltransferase family 39 protein [Patescibacteria group bacterium]MBU1066536.1 glycosyltransferase family 39 protein [Patescibacteria group bacterium]
MLNKLVKKYGLFFLILLVAVVLRFMAISKVPPSLNWDEISHGYNAYSILKTGKDEWGVSFPAIFRAYGDYKLPVYIYLTSVSEFFLGLSVLAVRLPSILAGIGVVIFTYLLAKELINKKVALISAFLVAIEPWSLFLSRGAFEANLSLFFIVSGIYLFIIGIKKTKWLPISVILLGLSVWTYNSARVFVPLLLVALKFIYKKELLAVWKKKSKFVVLSTILALIIFVPMFSQLLNPTGQARYGWVAIIDEGAITKINEGRNLSELSPLLARAVYNKGTYFVTQFTSNWFSHFSPEFLFYEGGSHYQFSVPRHGLIYIVNLLFFLIGLVVLIKKPNKGSLLLLTWLFLAPIPSSLTREAPHVLRAITMLPIPMIISASGFIALIEWFDKKYRSLLIVAYIIILAAFARNYLFEYFGDYRKDYSWSWQYGYEQAVSYVKQNYDQYDKVIVTKKYGEPHEFFLYFWPWNPSDYRNDENLIRFHQTDWYWVDAFDKLYFVNDWEMPSEGATFVLESKKEIDCNDSSCLLITSPGNYPYGWDKLDTIKFLNDVPAFEIYEKTIK